MEPKERKVGGPPTKEQEDAEPPKSTKTGKRTTTLEELGPVLPIGISTKGGGLNKSFDLFNFNTGKEREIGKERGKNETMASQVTIVLSNMLSALGDNVDFEELKPADRKLKIGQMYMADVFYMYVYCRVQALGDRIEFENVSCPQQCGGPNFNFVGHLNSTEVTTVDTEEDLLWDYELKRPVKLRGKVVEHLTLTTQRWMNLLNLKGGSIKLAKIYAVRGSVVGLVGLEEFDRANPTELIDAEVDQISKLDLEGLANGLNRLQVGPKMTLEGACPNCESKFVHLLDWQYDSFFSTSFQ